MQSDFIWILDSSTRNPLLITDPKQIQILITPSRSTSSTTSSASATRFSSGTSTWISCGATTKHPKPYVYLPQDPTGISHLNPKPDPHPKPRLGSNPNSKSGSLTASLQPDPHPGPYFVWILTWFLARVLILFSVSGRQKQSAVIFG